MTTDPIIFNGDVQKLLKIAQIVDKIDPREFHMGSWWIDADQYCRTKGCMIGHYAP